MRSGMLAAETAFDAIRAGDTSEAALKTYQDKIDASPIKPSSIRFATSTSRLATG